MAHKKKRPIQLTEKQKQFCELVVDNEQLHATEQVNRGILYLKAGYNSKHPDSGAAQEIKKKHIQAELSRVRKAKYGIEPEPETIKSEQEEAEENLKKWSTQSSQGANNYALYLLKKKEAGIIENTVRKVLLSAFLPESEQDEYADELPDGVVLAGKNKRDNKPESAKSPVNKGETA